MRHFDTAVVNVPLAKRGNIDAQIDRFKREQAAEQRAAAKVRAAQRREEKRLAKEALAQHGPAMIKHYSAKLNVKETDISRTLDHWMKMAPAKLLRKIGAYLDATDDRSHEAALPADPSIPF
jgi:ATP-dependent Clp protease ATP-binding subunit ClpA